MTIDFSGEEKQYLVNALINQDATQPQWDNVDERRAIALAVQDNSHAYTIREIGILQVMLQEHVEIYGRISSTANEKQPLTLASFSMHKQMEVIVSAGAKVGITLHNNCPLSIPNSTRTEGSRSIMIPILKVK